MGFEEAYQELITMDQDRFQRACRRLLKQTFVVCDKNEESRKLYFFISRHKELFSEYFGFMGYDVSVDTANRIAMLRNYLAENDSVRVRSGKLMLRKIDSMILCCLWTLYIDNLRAGNLTRPILIGITDLRYELEKYGVKDQVDKTAMKQALELFARYQLVEVNGELGDPECTIRLYASLQFALDMEEFKSFAEQARERLQGDTRTAWTEDEEETADEA